MSKPENDRSETPADKIDDAQAAPGFGESLSSSDVSAGLAAAFGARPTVGDTPVRRVIQYTAGAMIGDKYRLIERIGEGGMGFVWYAEQLLPVKRKVAIKLLKPGLDSHSVLGRFEAERQALALMDHPNIAKVFDAGMTDLGHPFFVMELVRGTSITTWCDQNKVDLRGRLELLIPVCQAIQHAHQKGIIHRDIKPSNVMVAMFDGQPVPKVIDFGIAKAFGTNLTELSLHTAFGAVVGTAEYMSPEQAELNNLDIDTRSDVYSLGVLMYELLTGSTPFPRAELVERGWQEALRVIRDVDPPVPSLRLSTSKMRASIAAVRSIEPKELGKLLKSELDWVVMKSLEKDRTRRYESASAIVNDLQRYLRDEPVEACPPSAIYQARKFIRRHRWPVMASTLLLVSLIVGVIGTSLGFLRAEAQRKLAEQARHEADERTVSERAAKLEAQRQQRIAEAAEDATLDSYRESTNDVIEKLIGSKDSIGTAERSYLESAHRRWQTFADRQGSDERSRYVRALGNHHLGLIWGDLDRPNDAVAALESAIRILDELASQYPAKLHYMVEAANARRQLAESLQDIGKATQAETELRKGIQSLEQAAAQHPEHEGYRFDLALSCDLLGSTLNALGRKEAEAQYRRSLQIFQQLASDDPSASGYRLNVSRVQSNLGNFLEDAGYTEEPEKLFREAVETLRLWWRNLPPMQTLDTN